jgi:hypothetical protein
MSVTGLLGAAWAMYLAHGRHLLRISFAVFAGTAVGSLLLTLLLGDFGTLVGFGLSVLAAFWVQAALVTAVADVRDGRADLSFKRTFEQAWPRVYTIMAVVVIEAVAVLIGIVLLIVPALVLLTWWAVVVPVVVLEGAGVFAAFGRSRELVSGRGWSVFVVVVVLFAVELAGALAGVGGGLLIGVAASTLLTPYSALVTTLLYYRLRGGAEAAPAAAA